MDGTLSVRLTKPNPKKPGKPDRWTGTVMPGNELLLQTGPRKTVKLRRPEFRFAESATDELDALVNAMTAQGWIVESRETGPLPPEDPADLGKPFVTFRITGHSHEAQRVIRALRERLLSNHPVAGRTQAYRVLHAYGAKWRIAGSGSGDISARALEDATAVHLMQLARLAAPDNTVLVDTTAASVSPVPVDAIQRDLQVAAPELAELVYDFGLMTRPIDWDALAAQL